MASNTFLECSICNEVFNEGIRCPRVLPCSHYFCTCCIDSLISSNRKQCPLCRRYFDGDSASDIMMNRAVLELLRYSPGSQKSSLKPNVKKRAKSATRNSNNNGKQNATNSIPQRCSISQQSLHKDVENSKTQKTPARGKKDESSSILEFMKKETTDKVANLILSRGVAKADAERSLQSVEKSLQAIQIGEEAIEEITSRLSQVKEEHLKNQETLEDYKNKFKNHLKETSKEIDKLVNIKVKLDEVETFEKTGVLMDEVKGVRTQIDLREVECRISSSKVMSQSIEKDLQKSASNIQEVLKRVKSMKLEQRDSCPHPSPKCSPSGTRSDQLTVKELQEISPRVKDLIHQGRLFAVQHQEAKFRSAKITFRGDKLLLHHLAEEAPFLSGSLTLKHNEVLNMIDVSSIFPMAFLELSANNQPLGTLFIRLSKTDLGSQFALCCTGEASQSFTNTKLLSVVNKGADGEGVRFGNGEGQLWNGEKGQIKRRGTNKDYQRPARAGVVTAVEWKNVDQAKVFYQFIICVKEYPDRMCDSAFGEVLEGLEVLTRAIQNFQKIDSVTISGCGLVLRSGLS